MMTFPNVTALSALLLATTHVAGQGADPAAAVRQLTVQPRGHVISNTAVWTPDSQWVVFDVRHDETVFDGTTIERVNAETGEVQVLYGSGHGAACGVVTCSPADERVVFIHGPEHPTADWSYTAFHRRGTIVSADNPGAATNLDARDITPPFTPGALRGGTHVHTFSGDGQWVSFTYEDHVLATADDDGPAHEPNQRNIGVSAPIRPVHVEPDHPRNHDGTMFSVLVTRTVASPAPGTDQISKAFSDSWVGTNGYIRADGSRQKRAVAFQGHVVTEAGQTISEVFIVDIPDDITLPGDGPLEGTGLTMPRPPAGCVQRRLTRTQDRLYPGLQGPRHWLRTSPDGDRIGFLMKDDRGVVQLWTVSPATQATQQVTHNPWPIQSAFSWSPDGRWVAYVADNSVFITDVQAHASYRLTPRERDDALAPCYHAAVFSPDGRSIAYMKPVRDGHQMWAQLFVVKVPQ